MAKHLGRFVSVDDVNLTLLISATFAVAHWTMHFECILADFLQDQGPVIGPIIPCSGSAASSEKSW